MSSIKFGVDIVNSDWKAVRETVLELEKQGFDSVWVMDHFWWENYDNNCLECWSTLSALASITERIRLGPLVSCNIYRAPSLLAKIAATFDVISGGRLDFGIGAGWFEEECRAYGIPFPPPAARVAGLRDAIRIIKLMWTEDKATYTGEYYQIRDAICEPKPIQTPRPPIWVGGEGRLMLKLTAQEADGINFYGSPEDFKERYKILKEFCHRFGREYDEIKKSWTGEVIVASDRRELSYKINELLSTRGDERGREYYLRRNLTGTPDEIRSQIEEYVALGVEYFWPDIEPSRTAMTSDDQKIFIDEVVKRIR